MSSHTLPISLLRAADAARNWRAILCLSSGTTISLASFSLCASFVFQQPGLAALFALLGFFLLALCYSATGHLLMRLAQGQTIGVIDAYLLAILNFHRMLGVALALLFICLLLVMTASLLLFLCKLNGAANSLYALVLPALSLALGISLFGIFGVALPLSAPAIWQGNTVFATVARLIQVVRQRLFDVVSHFFLLSLLTGLLVMILSLILAIGLGVTLLLSNSVGVGMLKDSYTSGGVTGVGLILENLRATGLGFKALAVLVATLPSLCFIYGSCLIYLDVCAGLEFQDIEQNLRDKFQQTSPSTSTEIKRKEPNLSPNSNQNQASNSDKNCSSCQQTLLASDLFCGQCGKAQH